MEKLMVKELTSLVMALFTTEILEITLANLKMVIMNHNNLLTQEDLKTILLMEKAMRREKITNLSDNIAMVTKLRAYFGGMLIMKDILLKGHSTIITSFMVVVDIYLFRNFNIT